MNNKYVLLILVSICFAVSSCTHAEDTVINKKIAAALKKFNPRFAAWKTGDYTPAIQKNADRDKRHPYALVLDFNGDKKNDVVLDGHDDKNNILLCLLSNPEGYDVIVLRKIDFIDPKKIENWNDGKKEFGLNYYLWPFKNGTGFTLAFPQQSDAKGNLFNDGGMIDYIYKDGKFLESYQAL